MRVEFNSTSYVEDNVNISFSMSTSYFLFKPKVRDFVRMSYSNFAEFFLMSWFVEIPFRNFVYLGEIINCTAVQLVNNCLSY